MAVAHEGNKEIYIYTRQPLPLNTKESVGGEQQRSRSDKGLPTDQP